MFTRLSRCGAPAALAIAVLASGCGGSAASPGTYGAQASSLVSSTSGAAALAPDANAAATGDIPDTQHFLPFHDRALGFSMVYPEGWAVRALKNAVTFQDINNLIRIEIASGGPPTPAAVRAQLASLKATSPSLTAGVARRVTLPSGPAVKITYTTQSAQNPVTGKRVTLMVDRYELARAGRVATVDLGTPVGVDNVDAYKKMIGSFRWG